MGRHPQRRVRLQRVGEMAHHLVQPVLRAVLHAGELVYPVLAARSAGRNGFAGKVFFRVGYHGLDAEELLPPVGGLDHKGVVQGLTVNGHVLVAGEQDVEVQLLAQPVRHILVGGGQHPARG